MVGYSHDTHATLALEDKSCHHCSSQCLPLDISTGYFSSPGPYTAHYSTKKACQEE